MGRSKWKGPYLHFNFLKKKKLNNILLKIWPRSFTILFSFIGFSFLVYSGKIFKKILIRREHVGFKFGEFCTTRAKYFHKDKLKAAALKKKKKNNLWGVRLMLQH